MNLASCRDPEDAVTKRVLLSVAVSLLTLNFAPGLAHPSSIQADDPEGPPGPGGLESADVQARPFEIQGHRGAKGLAPENSIEGFEKAIALGIDTLEMDAQSTRDRVLVVYHDQKINGARCRRVDGGASGSKLLKDLTLEEVQAIRCEGGAGIPTLEEVLRLAHAASYPVRANVEIKRQIPSRSIPLEEFAALLVEVIDATGMRGRVLVQSFEAEALLSMRRMAPDIPRAVISRDRGAYLAMVEDTTASALLPRHDRLQREDVEALHARGVAVIPWVVDDPDEMRRLRSWGVDGIITNRPDVAIEVRDGPARSSIVAETTPPPPTPWPPSAHAPTPPSEPPAQVAKEAMVVALPAYNTGDVRKVAVTYFTSGGRTDTFLTALFLDEFRQLRAHEPIDPYQLAAQPSDGERFHPAGMLDALFDDARQHSAEAIIIGVGSWYGPGSPGMGFRLEVRLIEVREGKVLWQATAKAVSVSGPKAKKKVVRRVLSSYPRARRH